MKALESQTIESHKMHSIRKCRVREKPGWQVSLEEWPHCWMSIRTKFGTKIQFGGLQSVDCYALRTLSSNCQEVAPRMQDGDRMVTRSELEGSWEN